MTGMLRLIKGGMDQPIEEEATALQHNMTSEIKEECIFQKGYIQLSSATKL